MALHIEAKHPKFPGIASIFLALCYLVVGGHQMATTKGEKGMDLIGTAAAFVGLSAAWFKGWTIIVPDPEYDDEPLDLPSPDDIPEPDDDDGMPQPEGHEAPGGMVRPRPQALTMPPGYDHQPQAVQWMAERLAAEKQPNRPSS